MNKKSQIQVFATIVLLVLISLTSAFVTSSNIEEKESIQYDTQDGTWFRKMGYPNCTYGPPDFSQFQDNWWNLFDLNYCYCGPVAAADCLWWLDCKLNNNSNPDYFLPDNNGMGSKNVSNVMPFINWTAEWLNTSKQFAADDRSGTTSHNMTKGLYEILNFTNMSNVLELRTQGLVDEGIWQEVPNYTNVMNQVSVGDDVILLLGFYCYDGIGYSQRYGGHYVQVNGYNNETPGLSFSDPFFDRTEDGGMGWDSTHTHWPEPYTNSSHNWTVNVSYDYYWVNDSTDFEGGMGAFEIIDYTNNATNWTGQNWMNGTYQEEMPCWEMPGEIRTIAEQAWFIGYIEGGNIEINKTVWNGTAWSSWYDAPVGTNATFNLTIHNIGDDITTNMTVWDTYYDCLGEYQVGSSWLLYPNGTRMQVEPNWTSYEPGTCTYAPHGHLGWYFNDYELENFNYCDRMYIEFNVSVNCTNYSANRVDCYICNISRGETECLYNYTATDNATVYIGREFDTLIQCIPNLTENSTWLVSEHVHRPCKGKECLDMNWSEYETEYDRWAPYNTTDGPDMDWEWVYRYDSTDGLGTDDYLHLSYTIVNDSSVNRSQSILRMRYNVTDYNETDGYIHMGIIYSYHNDSNYDMILFGTCSVLLLSKNDSWLENTNDSTAIYDIGDAYNYWDEYWSCNDTYDPDTLDPQVEPSYGAQGIWAKTIWNQFSNRLQTKAWNITTDTPFALYPYESSGWIADEFFKTTTVAVTKGGADGIDEFTPEEVATVIRVYQGGTTYNLFDDYHIVGNQLNWINAEDQPVTSTTYYVEYVAEINTKANAECFGLVIWLPPDSVGAKYYADFDFIEMWKLNYSTDEQANATEVAQRPVFNDTGIPLMYFNAFNHTDWLDEITKYYINCEDRYNNSEITLQQYADCVTCVYQNISKKVTMSVRGFDDPYKNCGISYEMDNQNDSIYYHSILVTNITNESYQNAMVIQIDVPTDGNYDCGDGVVMCVDVDNDQIWSPSDIAFVWWDWPGLGTHYTIYVGNISWSSGISGSTDIAARFYADWSEDAYNWSAINYMMPTLHRYSGHRVYRATIPTWYFRHKNIEDFLQVNETFGLHVMTVDAGVDGVPPGVSVPVWENYNTSSDLPLVCKESNGSDVWHTYLNLTSLEEIEQFYFYQNWSTGLSVSQIELWGHGRFGNEEGQLNTSFWSINASKDANKTTIVNISQDVLVNYTIEICNNGVGNVHNVTFNDTLPIGVEFVSSTIDEGNYSNPYDNVWLFNVTNQLNVSNCTNFTIQVNFTAGCSANGTYLTNYGNATCLEGAIASCNITVKYGENSAPVIDWEYPVDTATGVSVALTGLANISIHVTDADGDDLCIYFFTNKTSTWDSGWYAIGQNISNGETFGNGTYWTNQTFNVSERYNTQWRWGATTYTWYINVTDGNIWTNESKTYTTGSSRYDVTSSGDVVTDDVSWAWANRELVEPYLGIYDVDDSGDIITDDITDIWAHRTV